MFLVPCLHSFVSDNRCLGYLPFFSSPSRMGRLLFLCDASRMPSERSESRKFLKIQYVIQKSCLLPSPEGKKEKNKKINLKKEGYPYIQPLTHPQHLAIIPPSPPPPGGYYHERIKPCNSSSYNQKVPIRCSDFLYLYIM